MLYIWIGLAAAALVALLVYFRAVTKRHVSILFRSSVEEFMAGGMGIESAMREAIHRFIRRTPFRFIQPDELHSFLQVLQDLSSPVDVGAEILQKCENKRSIADIQDFGRLTRLAYAIDLKLNLRQLIQNARSLHRKVPDRYPNITIALLASLSVREGWTFIEEQNDALIFDYRQERVRIPKQGSGKDAARLILFEETAHRPMTGLEPDLRARRSARQEVIDNFDSVFDETFSQMGG